MSEQIMETSAATEAATENAQEQEVKTYTQEEFDNHMAGMRKSIESKFERQLADLGDLKELKALKAKAEKAEQEEQIKRGEFEKILQDMASKKDAEIQEKNRIIEEYTVNSPLLNAAAKYKAVNPEQVVQLIRSQVRLGKNGKAEVVDAEGSVRYDDKGETVSVDNLVQEFLKQNPHFVQAAPSTTNTQSSVNGIDRQSFNLASLDLTNSKDRELYKQAKAKGLV
jgi:hypothetical protein